MTAAGAPDAIVIGSGFGGALAAERLIDGGMKVVMIERGGWVPRGPENWSASGAFELTPYYTKDTPYDVVGEGTGTIGAVRCVGGPSVFYGAASFRFREADFDGTDQTRAAGAAWPIGYADLEPYYARAERLLGVAGEEGDPTAPFRSAPYPHAPPPVSPVGERMRRAAERLGLHPFRVPLAINYGGDAERSACASCATCDCFACAVGAKNDLASGLLPRLIVRGLRIVPNTVVVRMIARDGRIRAVECVERATGRRSRWEAEQFVLSAGAIASAHLVLASGLHERNPARPAIGRYLMRHANGMVFGLFRGPVDRARRFHKQIAIHDFYFGDPGRPELGKLGGIQQVHAPPIGLVRARVPLLPHAAARALLDRIAGLLVIAEDEPRAANGVELDDARTDVYGLPRLTIRHRYTARDRAARATLAGHARRILADAGALAVHPYPIRTFSHAVGTLRFGEDPRTAPLDPDCRFRGIDNLAVIDGSFMPTSAGVNPSLTIAANALRAAERLVERAGRARRRRVLRVVTSMQAGVSNG
jgi:choline dehydrogenase-like flavoprotein